MKLIGITQRVCTLSSHQEQRDALDQRWASFLYACGCISYPIPNHLPSLNSILRLPLQGIILTGGNSLNGEAPERDQTEIAILEYAMARGFPLLGVCRGMQLILSYFGSHLEKVKGHVMPFHSINIEGKKRVVNSYHDYGSFKAHKPLQIIGKSDDGVIEAIRHAYLPIHGIMWHPERNYPFHRSDQSLIHELFSTKLSALKN